MKKQILSVRDFAIIYNSIIEKISSMESCFYLGCDSKEDRTKRDEEHLKKLQSNILYQDLMRIRDILGTLNIEIETADIKIQGGGE